MKLPLCVIEIIVSLIWYSTSWVQECEQNTIIEDQFEGWNLDSKFRPHHIYAMDLTVLFSSTVWIKRIERRKWNRGRNGLHQLGQPIVPSVLLPVLNPPYPKGTMFV